ncbi:procathepsin L-like isoform X2 [Sitodiplosis mosellana]|uniref:procathepsin L-like isoform X2 n=1 Tax=Sitodiplosis mosellana TaxID=263140 RepID=UPI002444AB50|nr:procathepsin L-like isoform X2 [Sitodiplosis mosellana]
MNKFLIVFVYLFAATNGSVINSHEWDEYKSKYSKKYQNQADDRLHMGIFLQNKNEVMRHNQLFNEGIVSFTMSLNAYSDLSHTEFVSQMNGVRYDGSSASRNTTFDEPSPLMQLVHAVLPKSIDWRTKGAVTNVEAQGKCLSCWAFSVLGTVEAQIFRKTGRLVQLSAQNLVDCANSKNKCQPKSIHKAFDYIKRNGLETARSYPYRGDSGLCRYNSRNSAVTIKGYKDLPEGDETSLQQAIANIGPISVCVDASHKSFQHYSNGIYYEPKCRRNNKYLHHAVLVVGFGTDKRGKEYYIIKNSWGRSWGENGYMRLARNRKNHCGVATVPAFPIL